jgi:hypothetical protein
MCIGKLSLVLALCPPLTQIQVLVWALLGCLCGNELAASRTVPTCPASLCFPFGHESYQRPILRQSRVAIGTKLNCLCRSHDSFDHYTIPRYLSRCKSVLVRCSRRILAGAMKDPTGFVYHMYAFAFGKRVGLQICVTNDTAKMYQCLGKGCNGQWHTFYIFRSWKLCHVLPEWFLSCSS